MKTKTKYTITFGWDEICFNQEKRVYEYWLYDNESREYVFGHYVFESDFYDLAPDLGDFEYLFSAEFPVL